MEHFDNYRKWAWENGESPLKAAAASYLDSRQYDRLGARSVRSALHSFNNARRCARLERDLIERVQDSRLDAPVLVDDITTFREGEAVVVVPKPEHGKQILVGIVYANDPVLFLHRGFEMTSIGQYNPDAGSMELQNMCVPVISPDDSGFVYHDLTTGFSESHQVRGVKPRQAYRLPYEMLQDIPPQKLRNALTFSQPVVDAIIERVYSS